MTHSHVVVICCCMAHLHLHDVVSNKYLSRKNDVMNGAHTPPADASCCNCLSLNVYHTDTEAVDIEFNVNANARSLQPAGRHQRRRRRLLPPLVSLSRSTRSLCLRQMWQKIESQKR